MATTRSSIALQILVKMRDCDDDDCCYSDDNYVARTTAYKTFNGELPPLVWPAFLDLTKFTSNENDSNVDLREFFLQRRNGGLLTPHLLRFHEAIPGSWMDVGKWSIHAFIWAYVKEKSSVKPRVFGSFLPLLGSGWGTRNRSLFLTFFVIIDKKLFILFLVFT